jgi:DNA topoisomerase-6 subunit B
VWVPFTSEAKEALAHYPEITREIRLALQECGRKLSAYVNKKRRVSAELKKRSYIETYIPHISAALKALVGKKGFDEEKVKKLLKAILEKHRGELKKVEMDNPDYDEEYALSKDEGGKDETESN